MILAVAFVAVGCASTDEVVKRIDSNGWEVVQLGAKNLLDTEGVKLPTMNFNSEEKTVSGTTGCNNYTGGYSVDVYGIEFAENMIMTKMACPDADAIETAFIDVMKQATKFKLDGDELMLMDTAGLQILKARPMSK